MKSMLFRIDDTRPFWMTKAERDQKRHDLVLEGQTITRQYTKDEFLKQLRQRGMLAKGKKQAIQSKAQETTYQELKRLKQKSSKDGKIIQRVCCRYFGSVDLLTN